MADTLRDALAGVAPASGAECADLAGAPAGDAPAASETVWRAGALAELRGREVVEALGEVGVSADQAAATDAWSLAYEPTLAESDHLTDEAAARAEWWRAAAASDDAARMRAASVLRSDVARVGAAAMARAWTEYVQSLPPPDEGGEGDGDGDGDPAAAGERIARAAASAAAAARRAADEAEQASWAGEALGAGGSLDSAELARVLRAASQSYLLRRIIAEAGRAMRSLRAARRAVVRRADGRGGVERVGPEGLGRLVPAELVQLTGRAGAGLQLLALARLTDRSALAYAPDARRERARRGPVVVAVDESGSMSGTRIAAAKGLALAIAAAACRDGRHVLLVGWGTRSECRPLRLRPREPRAGDLVTWATEQFGGGTEYHVPLVRVRELIDGDHELAGAADVVLLTDGELPVPQQARADWRAWARRSGARLYLLGVGVAHAGDVAQVADVTAYVHDPAAPAAIELAARALEQR